MAKIPLSAILLAGGDSKRMGTNKALLRLEDKNLLEIVFYKLHDVFPEVIIVTDHPHNFIHLPAKFTGDIFTEGKKSALRGIHAGLTFSSSPSSFVTGCDMPFLSLPLIRYMAKFARKYDVVSPRLGEYYQPLFAFYNKTALNLITQRLKENKFKVTALYQALKIKAIDEETVRFFDPHLLSFFNINTKEDYFTAKQKVTIQ